MHIFIVYDGTSRGTCRNFWDRNTILGAKKCYLHHKATYSVFETCNLSTRANKAVENKSIYCCIVRNIIKSYKSLTFWSRANRLASKIAAFRSLSDSKTSIKLTLLLATQYKAREAACPPPRAPQSCNQPQNNWLLFVKPEALGHSFFTYYEYCAWQWFCCPTRFRC